ncbi:MAG: hypothetical protein NTX76_01740 [Alphaproteobacteria bacterium]|nr:hypothetical protein [Alphaproteobacteria bacterium]
MKKVIFCLGLGISMVAFGGNGMTETTKKEKTVITPCMQEGLDELYKECKAAAKDPNDSATNSKCDDLKAGNIEDANKIVADKCPRPKKKAENTKKDDE